MEGNREMKKLGIILGVFSFIKPVVGMYNGDEGGLSSRAMPVEVVRAQDGRGLELLTHTPYLILNEARGLGLTITEKGRDFEINAQENGGFSDARLFEIIPQRANFYSIRNKNTGKILTFVDSVSIDQEDGAENSLISLIPSDNYYFIQSRHSRKVLNVSCADELSATRVYTMQNHDGTYRYHKRFRFVLPPMYFQKLIINLEEIFLFHKERSEQEAAQLKEKLALRIRELADTNKGLSQRMEAQESYSAYHSKQMKEVKNILQLVRAQLEQCQKENMLLKQQLGVLLEIEHQRSANLSPIRQRSASASESEEGPAHVSTASRRFQSPGVRRAQSPGRRVQVQEPSH